MKFKPRALLCSQHLHPLITLLVTVAFLNSAASATAQLFTEVNPGLAAMARPCVAWGDFDGDGDLDVLVAGPGKQDASVTILYRNTNGSFADSGIVVPPLQFAAAAWGDFDGDGDLDLAMTGLTTAGVPTTRILRNDSGTNFTVVAGAFTGVYAGTVTWADFDGDGDLDLLVTGTATTGAVAVPATRLYRNDGGGVFTSVLHPFPNVYLGPVAWGDFDNDGDLDVVITGIDDTGALVAVLWRNNGAGVFTDAGANLPGMDLGFVAWGDFDGDGDLDLLFSGNSNESWITRIYRNDAGTLTDANAGLHDVFLGTLDWIDYDNDGDLDLLLAGNTGTSPVDFTGFYRNNSAIANTPPTAPSNLVAQVTGTSVTLGWTAANDAQTPAPALTYNLRVGITPGGSQIVPPHSSGSGYRFLPDSGNAGHNLTARLNHLKPGTNYFWSAQSVDTAFAGSPFAGEGTFSALADPPVAESIILESPAHIRVTWLGTPGTMYQVLTSTNLSSWNAVASPTAGTNGLFSFLDPIGSASAKFYRAVWP